MTRIGCRIFFSIFFLLLFKTAYSQDFSLKTNALYWAAATPNIGLEVAVSNKVTLDVGGAYNPWTYSDDRKMRFWLVQPEARYWLCEKFEGHFFGVHLHGAQYFGGFTDKRYDGYLAGGGGESDESDPRESGVKSRRASRISCRIFPRNLL